MWIYMCIGDGGIICFGDMSEIGKIDFWF